MPALIVALALAACSKQPPPQPPANQHVPVSEVKAAEPEPTDKCVAAKSCTSCIEASCQWDITKQACAQTCDEGATNCLLVGAQNIGHERASEVCTGSKQN